MYNHPLLLPVFLAEKQINVCFAQIETQHEKVGAIQRMTGQVNPNSVVKTPRDEIDFTELTRKMNFSAGVLQAQACILKGFAKALPGLEKWGPSLATFYSGTQRSDTSLEIQGPLREKLDYMQVRIAAALLTAENYEKRIEIYRQLVSALQLS